MNRITIDGTDYTDDIPEIIDFEIDIELNSENFIISLVSSNEMNIFGAGYEYVLSEWENDCAKVFDVQVYIECCDLTVDYKILPQDIKVCPASCRLSIELSTASDDLAAYDKLNRFIEVPIGTLPTPLKFTWANGASGGDYIDTSKNLFTIREYFEYYCDQVGLTFESFLQDDPIYKNSIMFHDGDDVKETRELQMENQTTLTPVEKIELLSKVMNTSARIRDGKLQLQRRDWFFLNQSATLFNIDEQHEIGCTSDVPCYSLSDENYYSYFDGQYDDDDQWANNTWYDDIVEWNPNGSPAQSGFLRAGEGWGRSGFQMPGFDSVILMGSQQGFLQDNRSYLPKLWIWNGIVQGPFGANKLIKDSNNNHNYPAWFSDSGNPDNLYARFWSIEQPFSPFCVYELDSITVRPDNFCEVVQDILQYGIDVAVETRYGLMVPEKIKINFRSKSITIDGAKSYKQS